MKRKLCSVLLALCMVLTLLPVSAMADVADTQSATSLPAADKNGVITLMEDVTLTSEFVVNVDQDLTLDLNGHSLTKSGTVILNNGRLTIRDTTKNGSIVSTNNVAISAGHNSTTTIEYANVRSVEGAVITSYATGATITIKDGVFSASDNAVIAGNGNRTDDYASGKPERVNPNTITINGGEFNGAIKSPGYVACGIYAPWKDNITVNGGTFNTTGNAIGKVGDSRVVVPCSALVFDSEAAYPALTNDSKITVNNGTFNSETSTISTMPKADDTNERVVVNSGTFSDLSALDYLASGAKVTVKLAADTTKDVTIPAGANVTLDLNGYKLTNASKDTIINNGNLTITGNGTVDNVTHGKAALINYGTATLNDGNYTRSKEDAENNSASAGKNSYYTILNDKGGNLTINSAASVTNGGHFSSMIRNGGDEKSTVASTLTINGGSFSGGINTVKNDELGILEINGGSFSNTSQFVVMNWHKATIKAGTFEALPDADAVLYTATYSAERAVGELTVTGGTFTCAAGQSLLCDRYNNSADYKGTAAISGGTFSVDPTPTTYVVESSIVRKDGDAQYTVVPKSNLTSGVYLTDPSGALASNYYVSSTANGVWTVSYSAPYSGGSSSYDPTYSVSTPSKTENGSVTVSPKNASKGDTVTVTVKPDSGYVLETLTVTDKNGNELTLKDKGDGKYTFTMPAGKVEVKATFMEDNSMLNFFYDVPNGAYFYEAVKWAVKNGITTGVGNDLFAPEQPCTRAQIVTFLWRAAGSPEPKGTAAGMTDVVSGSYYEKAVAWAIENGITTGTTTSTFSPDATCTRAQSVTFLHRALKGTASGSTNFTDVASDAFYADAVNWAVANNVTNGTSNTTFSPNADCTRAEIVTFLYRAYQGK